MNKNTYIDRFIGRSSVTNPTRYANPKASGQGFFNGAKTADESVQTIRHR